MPVVTTKSLVCDRCGASVPIESDGFTLFELDKTHPDWRRISGDRLLCPDCSPGYELLEARHKVELEDYIADA